MSNMSYCRFQNTLRDLQDCFREMGEECSENEHAARTKLIALCVEISEEYGDIAGDLPVEKE